MKCRLFDNLNYHTKDLKKRFITGTGIIMHFVTNASQTIESIMNDSHSYTNTLTCRGNRGKVELGCTTFRDAIFRKFSFFRYTNCKK